MIYILSWTTKRLWKHISSLLNVRSKLRKIQGLAQKCKDFSRENGIQGLFKAVRTLSVSDLVCWFECIPFCQNSTCLCCTANTRLGLQPWVSWCTRGGGYSRWRQETGPRPVQEKNGLICRFITNAISDGSTCSHTAMPLRCNSHWLNSLIYKASPSLLSHITNTSQQTQTEESYWYVIYLFARKNIYLHTYRHAIDYKNVI